MSTPATFTKVGIVEESNYGVTPASALQLLNVSSIDLTRNQQASRPNVLTGDRRRFPKRILSKSGGLVLPAPMQYENMLLLEEGLQNASRGAAVSISATTISVTGANTVADSANGLGDLDVGDLFYMSGWAGANVGNNGWKGPILTAAAGSVTIPAGQVTNATAGDSVVIKTRRLLDGSTAKSYSAEYQLTQLTNQFKSGVGYRVGEIAYDWAQNEWATMQATLMGKVPGMANATIGTGAATAAKTTGFMNAVDDFQLFKLIVNASTTLTAVATKWGLKVMNVQTATYGLGNVGPSEIVVGPQDVDLAIDFYMDDDARDVVDIQEAHTTFCAWWATVDPQGNRIAFCCPAMKPDDGDTKVGEAESIVTYPLTASGHDPAKDSSSLATAIPYQFGIFYVPAA